MADDQNPFDANDLQMPPGMRERAREEVRHPRPAKPDTREGILRRGLPTPPVQVQGLRQ